MDHTLSEDHQLLIEAVRDFARSELLEKDRQWDADEASCCTELAPLAEMGLLGLRIPESAGGMGCPAVVYGRIIRELAWASPSVAVTVSVHNMVAEILEAYGSEPVRREILPKLAEPDNLAAFAISEPNAGSDPASARTKAEPAEGGWILTGTKMWVTNGVTGRWFAVLARCPDGGGDEELTMFLVDATCPQVSRRPIHGKMGIRGSETAEMALDGLFVPAERMLGQIGDGLKVALSALDGGRIGIANQAIGIGQACLDQMLSYSTQREQFGQKIAGFQAIQWMIADSYVELQAAGLLADRAAWLKDAGRPFTHEASMAKLFASEAANRIAYRAVQVHGGYGFVHEFRVEQLYRDARITTIYEGTSEIQRLVIARRLLGL